MTTQPSTLRAIALETTLGDALMLRSNAGLVAVEFGDNLAELFTRLEARYPHAVRSISHADFAPFIECFVNATEGEADETVQLDFDVSGTVFQQSVWDELKRIPSGSTTTYKSIASQMGKPSSYRAVANAIGANPIAVLIPCHRVIRADHTLGGYRWGIDRKEALLQREAATLPPQRCEVTELTTKRR